MARWITVTKAPFDFPHSRSSWSQFNETGEFHVIDALADFAIERGYAKEGRAEDSTARSTKSGPKAVRGNGRRKVKTEATESAPAPSVGLDAVTANLRPNDRLAGEDLDNDDSADDGPALDPAGS